MGFISFRECPHLLWVQVQTGYFLRTEIDRGMKPNIRLHLAPKLKMSGAIPGLPHDFHKTNLPLLFSQGVNYIFVDTKLAYSSLLIFWIVAKRFCLLSAVDRFLLVYPKFTPFTLVLSAVFETCSRGSYLHRYSAS
jgi:hypothetical protein